MELERIFVTLLFMATSCLYAQKYTTKTGVVKFEATVPSFEEVAGENKTVSAAFDTGTGDIAVLALMKGFRFKVALMEEHFNENYVESDKFPKATFKGKVEGFDLAKLAAAGGSYTISGDLTLHGKTKKVTDTAKITKQGDKLVVSGAFEVKPADFGIEVPAVVSKKVADKISITYSFTLTK
ncbi:MAG: YceI family protein [Bacteroidota bacterium]